MFLLESIQLVGEVFESPTTQFLIPNLELLYVGGPVIQFKLIDE